MPGGGSYITANFTYTWNATTGLLDTFQYPQSAGSTPLKLQYGYSNGYLQSIKDFNVSANTYWTANAENPRGQITEETTAASSSSPQIETNRTYDAVTGWMGSIKTGVNGGNALQGMTFLYDEVGNVTQRQNGNLGLTENIYYDNLYRLYYSTLGGTKNLQMCYDNTGSACTENLAGMGKITSRSDVAGGAAWTYDTGHVHEVTQAGSTSFVYTYDANGNAKTRNGSSITWTSYNYPSAVATTSESASFDYGPNRQRWRMVYTNSTGTETTYYPSPEFEQVITSSGTDYRHYIYAMGRAVMVISRTTAGAVNVRSLLADNQGSIAQIITDSTGANLQGESFTPYGSRRESTTWSGPPTSSELNTMNGVTREGYTFQTVLGSMGLDHMNGRILDSVTGVFLSPDPVLSNPTSTLDYNRYSYVHNNPLSFNDPTGFSAVPACEPGMCNNNSRPPILIGGGNTGGGGLEGIVGNDATYADDFGPGGVYAPYVGGGNSSSGNPSGGNTGSAGGSNGSNGLATNGGGGGAGNSGSVTFQICQDGACSDPIDPDLLPVVPDASYRYANGPGTEPPLQSVLGPVEYIGLALLGIPVGAGGAAEGAADLVTVTHFTSAEGAAAIEASGALRAGSFVTFPSEVSGLSATEVESALEIQSGRGAFSTSFQTPASNLGPAFNGTYTSGGALQFQLNGPVSIAPGAFLPVGP